MDLNKIFLKNACPTSIGGQAVMEGVMMRGPDRTAVAVRLPDNRIFLKTSKNEKKTGWTTWPLIRGIVSFIMSLVMGTKILTYSADVLASFDGEDEEKLSPFEQKLVDKFGEDKVWKFISTVAMLVAVVIALVVFVIIPTMLVNLLRNFIDSSVLLNLIEGVFRMAIFVTYIALVSRMKDIRRTFEFHGAEHKTIHCYENNMELTPENAKKFYRLHPRCGTSFLMFVMVISLVLFSLLGWPSLIYRILSRIALLPAVASLSYELLRWAGRSDNKLVEILSVPGLLLQKLTTKEPDEEELEIAIVSMKAVLVPEDTPVFEGICDTDANPIEEMHIKEAEEVEKE